MGKFLVDDRPLVWLALAGFALLIVLTAIVYRVAHAQISMYATVLLFYFYTAVLMLNSPSIVNYVFAWIGLLISAYYQEYGPIILAGSLTATLQTQAFLVHGSAMFPTSSPVDVIYPLLFCIFITAFLLYLTTFTKRLWLSAEQAEQQLRYVLDSVDVLTWQIGRFGEAPSFSAGLQQIAGMTIDEFRVRPDRWMELIHPDDAVGTEHVIQAIKDGQCKVVEFRLVRPDGQIRWVQTRVVPITDNEGKVQGMQGVLMDITKNRTMEERIKFLAYNDQLTGLPNRPAFLESARFSLQQAAACGGSCAVLFIDLDGFKQVNDTAGHEVGDRVLALIAQRLRESVGARHSLCRLGGDEFAVLLVVEQAEEAILATERIIKALTQPIAVSEKSFSVGCSIGISYYPEDGQDVESLLRHADRAMYQAKADGRILPWHVFRTDSKEAGRAGLATVARVEHSAQDKPFIKRAEDEARTS